MSRVQIYGKKNHRRHSRYITGGFWISNVHETKYKKGDKFKKNDIISINNSFFDVNSNEYYGGPLMKVAVGAGDYLYDDSSLIREGLGELMTSLVTKRTRIPLGPNANVDKIVNVGDNIKTGKYNYLPTYIVIYKCINMNCWNILYLYKYKTTYSYYLNILYLNKVYRLSKYTII